MIRNILNLFAVLLVTNLVFSQVGIGTATPHPSTSLDMVSSDRGFLGPQIALKSRTDNTTIPNPTEGLLVFNTTTLVKAELDEELKPSYYFWSNGRWQSSKTGEILTVTTNGVLQSYLPYVADGVHRDANFVSGGITFTKKLCMQWTKAKDGGNDHWYCSYEADKEVPSWQEIYNAAESVKGYMVTFTTLKEWEWVKANIVEPADVNKRLTNSIWIGYNKVNFSGNGIEFTWITGEESEINWGNKSTTQHNFNGGEPNNSGNNEGCVHVISEDNSPGRKWNDIPCENPGWARPYNHIIIEFEK